MVRFLKHIQHDPQFSTVAKHEHEWQDFTTITFNAQQRQKRLEGSNRIMKRYWTAEDVNALMAGIKSRHIDEEATKLAKRYPEEYEKAIELIQQAVLQKKKQIHRNMRETADYILFDFWNVADEDYKNLTVPTSANLRKVDLRRKDQRLIEDISDIVPSEGGYVSSSSISSTPLLGSR